MGKKWNKQKSVNFGSNKPEDNKPLEKPEPLYVVRADDHAYHKHHKPIFLEEFKKHGTLFATLRALGLNYNTYADWRKKDPEFDRAFMIIDAQVTESLERKAMSMALAGDQTLLIFLLKSRNKRYQTKTYHEVSIKFAQELVNTISIVLNDELPTMCPHCEQQIPARQKILDRLKHEMVNHGFEESKTIVVETEDE